MTSEANARAHPNNGDAKHRAFGERAGPAVPHGG
jgi:hypothetical protein